MQEPQEKHQDKYKKNFSKKNLLPEFLLSGNRLPEGRNRLLEA